MTVFSRRMRLVLTAVIAVTALISPSLGFGSLSRPLTAQGATAPETSAFGVQILDSDGGVQQAKMPLSEWSSGPTTSNTAQSTGDFFKLNTTQSQQLSTSATSDGALASIASGTYQLRDRPAVSFTGLQASCSRDRETSVSFATLNVDGKDILQSNHLDKGYTYDLPNSKYGATRLYIGQRGTGNSGSHGTATTALRIEAEAGASEIWRVQLGVVSCSPDTQHNVTPLVSGITATNPDGAPVIDRKPQLTAAGKTSLESLHADSYPITAEGVTAEHTSDNSSRVSISSYEQIPDTSAVGMYTWSALRVYGLSLEVNPDGTSAVTFTGGESGVFANGVWINTGTDLYIGMGADGNPRIHIYFNERVTNSDGSITINALRYEDLTGQYPSVILGQVHWSAASPSPNPSPDDPANPGNPGNGQPADTPLPKLYAYGISATGPSRIGVTALACGAACNQKGTGGSAAGSAAGSTAGSETAASSADVAQADDGHAGQITAKHLTSSIRTSRSFATISSLVLYPGTALETHLDDIAVTVDGNGAATMTTNGGSVAGTIIKAGPVAPNTTISVADRSARITLNHQERDSDGIRSIVGVLFDDPVGLGAQIQAAVITTALPDPNDTNQSDGDQHHDNGGNGAGHDSGLSSGALAQSSSMTNGGLATGVRNNGSTGSNDKESTLSTTGSNLQPILISAATLLALACALMLIARRRQTRR